MVCSAGLLNARTMPRGASSCVAWSPSTKQHRLSAMVMASHVEANLRATTAKKHFQLEINTPQIRTTPSYTSFRARRGRACCLPARLGQGELCVASFSEAQTSLAAERGQGASWLAQQKQLSAALHSPPESEELRGRALPS